MHGAVSLNNNAIPVVFGAPVDSDGVSAVDELLAHPSVAGFLRIQVHLPRSGCTPRKDSAFEQVPTGAGSCVLTVQVTTVEC
jgi:hypothetical protein